MVQQKPGYVPESMQDCYDETVRFILANGRGVRTDSHGGVACLYRAGEKPGSKACAAGMWIPDNRYFTGMEGKDLSGLLAEYPFMAEFFPFPELTRDLQRWHDTAANWESTVLLGDTGPVNMSLLGYNVLRDIAAKYNLTPHPLVINMPSKLRFCRKLADMVKGLMAPDRDVSLAVDVQLNESRACLIDSLERLILEYRAHEKAYLKSIEGDGEPVTPSGGVESTL